MPVPAQLSVLLFHVGVAMIAVVPRLPVDRPFPISVGGDLSHNFRRIMLGLVISNIIRILFFQDSRFVEVDPSEKNSRLGAFVYHALKALESFLRSFLCLLTPYLMQCQLQNRINIQPGRDLMIWVYLVVAFSVFGCALVEATGNAGYWCIKEFGDALSFPPVYKTLKLYSSIITPGGRYPGRGDMPVQTLLIVEYLAVVATALSAVGYIMMSDTHPIFEAFRQLGAFVNLTRLLCHAMLMNAKDEAQYFQKFASAEPDDKSDDDVTSEALIRSH
jgi:hypothetical protein